MSQSRFGWLLRNLHLSDTATQLTKHDPNFDKLYKPRLNLDALSETSLNSFVPIEHQSIDKFMISYTRKKQHSAVYAYETDHEKLQV